ncbi:flagellar hook assembly protein FlgD [Alkalicoccobacillus porphyridii]|uniref:Flagellar hook assembly protein FlgD n=1 Tax=Alkalicoccobacillus porphyridii TaxID=2597270 RepID=A0A553ZYA4_9BACI|nr:flagellar hook assembly protein FlgD [Alkalicoccobacillus porphyridii]TSB46414.1 flagellar hook assembly protein FlgD [Alkalicoccobacillus porphyridii]
MSVINSDYYMPNPQNATRKGDTLGKDDFLRLLLIQLQNQDPSNPVDDREFIAQMATFSSLEQMTNMNKTLEGFVQSQANQSLVKYSDLIGKEVSYQVARENDQSTETSSATVTSVKYDKNRQLQIGLEDGTWISEGQIVGVAKASEKQVEEPDQKND